MILEPPKPPLLRRSITSHEDADKAVRELQDAVAVQHTLLAGARLLTKDPNALVVRADGRILLTSGTTLWLQHGLGRVYRGWLLVSQIPTTPGTALTVEEVLPVAPDSTGKLRLGLKAVGGGGSCLVRVLVF